MYIVYIYTFLKGVYFMTIQNVIDILSKVDDKSQPVYCTDTEMYHTEELIELNIFSYSSNPNLDGKIVFVRDA